MQMFLLEIQARGFWWHLTPEATCFGCLATVAVVLVLWWQDLDKYVIENLFIWFLNYSVIHSPPVDISFQIEKNDFHQVSLLLIMSL